ELPYETAVVGGANSVPEAVGPERLQCAAHRRGPRDFAGVRDRAEPFVPRECECRLVRLRRMLRLQAPETDADHPTVAVPPRPADGRDRLLERVAARDVRRQSHFDAVLLDRLLRAGADAFEHLLPVDTTPRSLRRREDPLDVDGAVLLRLCGVVDDHLAEVALALQR